jgi:hypothetical protein
MQLLALPWLYPYVFEGVTDAQVVRASGAIGTGGGGQLPGEAERQRCRKQRGETSRAADQLCVHDRSVLVVWCPREGIGVVLMRCATVGRD